MNRNILVVSAHPDDETLGCGGALLRHKNIGDTISWIIVTCVSEENGFKPEFVKKRATEIKNVSDMYGMYKIIQFKYPTTSLTFSSLHNLIHDFSKAINEVKPSTIYTTNRSDVHSDHRITFEAIMASTKSFRTPFVKEVLMYECISETEFTPALQENIFQPNCFINITNEIDEKIEIMKIYESEIGEHPFPRSEKNIRALATFRGATAGFEYAEAFQVLKSIRDERL